MTDRPDAPHTDARGDEVVFGRVGGVGHILLNRPTKLNSITPRMARLLDDYLTRATEDPEIRVLVISGAGDRAFCTGADLNAVMNGEGDLLSTERGGFGGIVRFPRVKPLIAAVQGHTIAGGFEIALSCDLIVAEDGSSFSLPEIRRGLIPNGGGLTRLPRLLPPMVANDVILTGRTLGAAEALSFGLVSRLVPRGEGLTTALEIATELAAQSPEVVTGSLRVVHGVTEGAAGPLWDLSAAIAQGIRSGEHARSAAKAFVERVP
jgi:enoyl-CoA hydratase/carnithine racemase